MHGERTPSGLPSSPTGRVPQWVLDEVSNAQRPSEPWRSWTPAAPRRKRRRWAGVAGALLVVAAAVVGTDLGVLPRLPALSAAAPGNRPGFPSPGVEEADEPLGTPVAAPASGGTYRFMATQDDGVTPVAYDPCRPIHYVVRPDNAPFGGDQLITDAVARISQLTGLLFVLDGPTDEAPSDQREPFQEDRYGDRWAPVLITWDTVTEQPDLAAGVAGLGGSQGMSVDGGPGVFVTGKVEFDAVQLAELLTGPDGPARARAIVLHELGHLVGLDHVGDPTQLMYPEAQPTVVDFGSGDLTGLAQLGAGKCVPEL